MWYNDKYPLIETWPCTSGGCSHWGGGVCTTAVTTVIVNVSRSGSRISRLLTVRLLPNKPDPFCLNANLTQIRSLLKIQIL